jgi:hypothetical protein
MKNLLGFVLITTTVLAIAASGICLLLSSFHLDELWFGLFREEGTIVFFTLVTLFFIGSAIYPVFRKSVTESLLWFTIASASTLTIIAVGTYLCLIFLFAYFQVPSEGLSTLIFLFVVAPWIFILSIPYAIGMKWVLKRKGIATSFRQFIITLIIGTPVIVLILAVIFPCNTQPFFVGGYLMKSWFGGQ